MIRHFFFNIACQKAQFYFYFIPKIQQRCAINNSIKIVAMQKEYYNMKGNKFHFSLGCINRIVLYFFRPWLDPSILPLIGELYAMNIKITCSLAKT